MTWYDSQQRYSLSDIDLLRPLILHTQTQQKEQQQQQQQQQQQKQPKKQQQPQQKPKQKSEEPLKRTDYEEIEKLEKSRKRKADNSKDNDTEMKFSKRKLTKNNFI